MNTESECWTRTHSVLPFWTDSIEINTRCSFANLMPFVRQALLRNTWRSSRSCPMYNTAYDDTYFVTRFLGGLKEEIRAAIGLHRPKNVLAASSLALLQEEEIAVSKGKAVAWDFHKSNYKPSFVSDKNKLVGSEKPAPTKSKGDKGDSGEKVKALMLFRKKMAIASSVERNGVTITSVLLRCQFM